MSELLLLFKAERRKSASLYVLLSVPVHAPIPQTAERRPITTRALVVYVELLQLLQFTQAFRPDATPPLISKVGLILVFEAFETKQRITNMKTALGAHLFQV